MPPWVMLVLDNSGGNGSKLKLKTLLETRFKMLRKKNDKMKEKLVLIVAKQKKMLVVEYIYTYIKHM